MSGSVLFVLLAGVLAVAVLAIPLRPLWRSAPRAIGAVVVALALVALGLYRLLGTPAALDPQSVKAPASLDEAITQLRARLEQDPEQVEGWRLLGRSYATQGQKVEAREAFARAATLAPDDPDVLTEAAESRALAHPDHLFDPQAVALLQHALALQPMNQRARWFFGISQRQSGDAAGAAKTWEPLLGQVDAGTAASLRPEIDAARRDAGLPPLPQAAAPAGASGTALSVKVRLDPKVATEAHLEGTATVFVIARASDGPPMPVAVERHGLQDLPLTAELDDSDSLMPTQRLSALSEVELIARISRSGDATPKPGDLESPPLRVRLPATQPIELTINRVRE